MASQLAHQEHFTEMEPVTTSMNRLSISSSSREEPSEISLQSATRTFSSIECLPNEILGTIYVLSGNIDLSRASKLLFNKLHDTRFSRPLMHQAFALGPKKNLPRKVVHDPLVAMVHNQHRLTQQIWFSAEMFYSCQKERLEAACCRTVEQVMKCIGKTNPALVWELYCWAIGHIETFGCVQDFNGGDSDIPRFRFGPVGSRLAGSVQWLEDDYEFLVGPDRHGQLCFSAQIIGQPTTQHIYKATVSLAPEITAIALGQEFPNLQLFHRRTPQDLALFDLFLRRLARAPGTVTRVKYGALSTGRALLLDAIQSSDLPWIIRLANPIPRSSCLASCSFLRTYPACYMRSVLITGLYDGLQEWTDSLGQLWNANQLAKKRGNGSGYLPSRVDESHLEAALDLEDDADARIFKWLLTCFIIHAHYLGEAHIPSENVYQSILQRKQDAVSQETQTRMACAARWWKDCCVLVDWWESKKPENATMNHCKIDWKLCKLRRRWKGNVKNLLKIRQDEP